MTRPHIYSRKARGKLMLTGEYFVLNGASSISIPSLYGQEMKVYHSDSPKWYVKNNPDEDFKKWSNHFIGDNSNQELIKLNRIFDNIQSLKGDDIEVNYEFHTSIEFNKKWGLGTSSTLIALLADYYKVDAFELNKMSFSGSGYDVACAFSESPIQYKIEEEKPVFQEVTIDDTIKEKMYFVYLGEKVNSEKAIVKFGEKKYNKLRVHKEIDEINRALLASNILTEWIELLERSEDLTSKVMEIDKINLDIPFYHKYLGAWGGDFALILTDDSYDDVKIECERIGLNTVFKYSELLV